jgi:transposase
LLARSRTEIRRANQEILPEDQPPPEKQTPSLPLPQTWRQQPSSRAERLYEAHQAEREDRYRQIAALRGQGMTHAAIAQRVGVSTCKVRSWLKQDGAPVHRRPQGHDSLFDPYATSVLERWRAGVRDGKQLYEEIRQQGYSGSLRLVRLFLQPLREQPGRVVEVVPPSPVEQFCARDAVWLFIREKSKLTPEEQEELLHIRSASVTVETAYGLVQEFLTMVRERRGERLKTWIEAVQSSQIPELGRFVKGILQDKEAVVAGLTEVYSNGQTEGQVHKLKLVKRSMHGRAKLPLLRQRLLNVL